jgi:hypothetical protein
MGRDYTVRVRILLYGVLALLVGCGEVWNDPYPAS